MPTPRTVLRSIRITPAVADVLTEEAHRRGISVNAVVSQVLTKYVEWDRFADRFGFVTITRDGYRKLHDALPEKDFDQIADAAGSTYPKEIALFFFKRLGVESFIEYLNLSSRYAGWVEVDVRRVPGSIDIALRHGLGERYSRFLARYIAAAAREIARVPARTETHAGSVVLHLTA